MPARVLAEGPSAMTSPQSMAYQRLPDPTGMSMDSISPDTSA